MAVVALRRRPWPFHQVERWQTSYLPVFVVWAAAGVLVLPPAFGFD